MSKDNKVRIELSQEEARVLFEFLDELEESGEVFTRKADYIVLSNLTGQLERKIIGMLDNPDYSKELEEMRREIGSRIEDDSDHFILDVIKKNKKLKKS